jgi:hypothetical protein
MPDAIFVYKKNGKDAGFKSSKETHFTARTGSTKDTDISMVFPLDKMTENLRRLVKEKKARIIKAGTTEAVTVPQELLLELYR